MSNETKRINLGENFFTQAANILILNFLCMICCIPIITIADSLSSLYYVMLKIVRKQEDGVVKPFFRFFRDNFLKSLPYTLLMILAVLVCLAGFMVFQSGLGLLLVIPVSIILTILFGWVIPLFAQFDNTTKQTFENALKLAVEHPEISLVILAANGYMTVLFLVLPGVFAYVLYLWDFIGLAVSALIICKQVMPVFDALIPETKTEETN